MAKVGYARVSSVGQSLDVQREKLCDCDRLFEEKRSGTTDARPQFKQCLDYVRDGDQLLVTHIDRLARSTLHLCQIAETLRKKGVILSSSIRTSTRQTQLAASCSTCLAPSASLKPKSAPSVRWTGSRRPRTEAFNSASGLRLLMIRPQNCATNANRASDQRPHG